MLEREYPERWGARSPHVVGRDPDLW